MKTLSSLVARLAAPRVESLPDAAEAGSRRDRNDIFDNVARALGSTISRRKAIKLTAVGLAGVAFSEFGVTPVWAFVTCDCNGQSYDPAVSCCTPSGVQRKHPIVDLDACPGRVARPGSPSPPNGCGPANSPITPYIPNSFGKANFKPCCDAHDNCYGTCKNQRSGCDGTFGSCLGDSCSAAYGNVLGFITGLFTQCLRVAAAYELAVRIGGSGAYNNAQQLSCICCGNQTCSNCNSPGTCTSAAGCGGGCACFLTVEGTAFCHRGQSCAGSQTCSSSANCPPGFACSNITCCGSQAICIQPCSAAIASPQDLNAGPMTTSF